MKKLILFLSLSSLVTLGQTFNPRMDGYVAPKLSMIFDTLQPYTDTNQMGLVWRQDSGGTGNLELFSIMAGRENVINGGRNGIAIFSINMNDPSPTPFMTVSSEYTRLFNNPVIVGEDGSPDTNSIFELKSTTKGFLLMRMSAAQRIAISPTPPDGLFVYQNDSAQGFYGHINGQWVHIGSVTQFLLDPTLTNVLSIATSTNTPTLTATDFGASRLWFWDNTENRIKALTIGANLTLDDATDTLSASAGGGGGTNIGYTVFMEESSPITSRTNAAFIGSGITATDNAASNRTDIALSASLNAIADLAANGFPAKTGAGTYAIRTNQATEGIQVTNGAGIAGDPSFSLDINGLTADATPNPAADYLATYDASAGTHKKVLVENLFGGQGLRNSYRTKTLNANGNTDIITLTPTGDMRGFGCVIHGTVEARTSGLVYVTTWKYAITVRRQDPGGTDASSELTIEEEALSLPNLVYDPLGEYSGATSATVSIGNIDTVGYTAITIYFYVEQLGPGTITFP